jgi:16S rRNA (cytidine1402-2'-O)-methyltransferase
MTASAGTLFVVATPIGNLEDFTFRALRTLREVDVIAAEDTRRTAKLLAHYDVHTPLVSVREHNEPREAPRLIERLKAGASIALVTDAGTPGISDPGARVVRAVREAGLKVVPIPGPSAVTAALSVAGCPADEFVFRGFPPPAGGKRAEWLDNLASDPRLTVFFEAPHRIERTLGDLESRLSGRKTCVFRELTKIHEESTIIDSSNSLVKQQNTRGEMVVVVEPADTDRAQGDATRVGDMLRAVAIVGQLTDQHDFDTKDAVVMAAALVGLRPSTLKRAVKAARYSVKRQNDTAT